MKTFKKIYDDFGELFPTSRVKRDLMSVLRRSLTNKNPYMKYIYENGHTYVWYSHELLTKHSRMNQKAKWTAYTKRCLKEIQDLGYIHVIRRGPRRYIRVVEDAVEKALQILNGVVEAVETAVAAVVETTTEIFNNFKENARTVALKASTYLENLTMNNISKPLPAAPPFKTFDEKMKNPKYACKVEIDKTNRPKAERDILKKLVDISVFLAKNHKEIEFSFYDLQKERWQNCDFLQPCPDKGLTILYKDDAQKDDFLRYSDTFRKVGIYLHQNPPPPLVQPLAPSEILTPYKNAFSEEKKEPEKLLDFSKIPDEYKEIVANICEQDKVAAVWLANHGLENYDRNLPKWADKIFDENAPKAGITLLTIDEFSYKFVKKYKLLYENYGIYLYNIRQ